MQKYFYTISFLFLSVFSCSKQPADVLAFVNDDPIALNNYHPQYTDFLDKTLQKDNLANRYTFLNTLIDEKMILDHACKTGFDQEPEVQQEKIRIHDQLLLDHLYVTYITPRTQPTETELRKLFSWSKTALHVRHLYAKDLETILTIQEQLKRGKTFEKLAAKYFKDQVLKNNGGDLGWIKMSEMDPAFEVAAFSLNDHEISAPVRTEYGYSIIQVLEKEKDVFLTEQEFQLQKKFLAQIAAQYNNLPQIRAFTDSIENDIAIAVNEKELPEFFAAIKNDPESGYFFDQQNLVEFQDRNPWTIKETYSRLIHDLSPRQFSRINSQSALLNTIKGLAIREHLLSMARNKKVQDRKQFRKEYEQKISSYLIQAFLKNQLKANEADNLQILKQNYFDFRNELAAGSTIRIDSLTVRSFIFHPET